MKKYNTQNTKTKPLRSYLLFGYKNDIVDFHFAAHYVILFSIISTETRELFPI